MAPQIHRQRAQLRLARAMAAALFTLAGAARSDEPPPVIENSLGRQAGPPAPPG